MAVSYYLTNAKKKAEYEGFQKFWEEAFCPEFRARLTEYCKNIDGVLINEDLAENLFDYELTCLKYCPLLDDCYSMRIGQRGQTGFHWDNVCYENIRIASIDAVRKAVEQYPDVIIEDEEGQQIGIGSFEKIVTLQN